MCLRVSNIGIKTGTEINILTKNASRLVSEKDSQWLVLHRLHQLLALTLLDDDPGTRITLLGSERLHLLDDLPAVAILDPPEDNVPSVQPAEIMSEHLWGQSRNLSCSVPSLWFEWHNDTEDLLITIDHPKYSSYLFEGLTPLLN